MSDNFAIIAQKKALRLVFKAKRRKLLHSERIDSIKRINQSLLTLIEALKRPDIAGYCAIGDEIPILECLKNAQNCGYDVGLPVVVKPNMPLIFRSWKAGDDLGEGAFKIPEPSADKRKIEPSFVIVPLLAFDSLGYRLGYGGGFYDRTIPLLKQINPETVTVGVAFNTQKSPDLLPIDGYDQGLDYIITEQETLSFKV